MVWYLRMPFSSVSVYIKFLLECLVPRTDNGITSLCLIISIQGNVVVAKMKEALGYVDVYNAVKAEFIQSDFLKTKTLTRCACQNTKSCYTVLQHTILSALWFHLIEGLLQIGLTALI